MYERDTIAAIATPPGEGGVAIVRVSGIGAEKIATKIFVRSRGNNSRLRSHTLYHGKIHDPKNDTVLDEVLVTIMRQPRSYTGEDVFEIHCHGGVFLVRQILGLVLTHGARQAEPGEFTKRAFLNGKVDLTQAEGVLDLVRARTAKGAELALGQARGALSKFVTDLREELLGIIVQVEAAIDFPEEEIELLRNQQLIEKMLALEKQILYISDTYKWGRLFREGAKVCICGRPNVGKSSLLNALLGEDRAIVAPLPGTTRDVIEVSINLDGLPVVLWDTAGLREAHDRVERIGVNLALEYLSKADAALVVLDGSVAPTEEDRLILKAVDDKRHLIAVNKSDLQQRLALEQIGVDYRETRTTTVSAKSLDGIESLKMALRDVILDHETEPSMAVTNLRHYSELIRGRDSLSRAIKTAGANLPAEFIAIDLSEAREALEEIIGVMKNDDVLERIFRDFCMGK